MSYPTSAIAVKRKKKENKTGQIILNILILVFVLVCTLPFINVIAISLSSKSAILRGDVSFWPVEFSTRAYEVIINDPSMFHSLGYTVKITIIYTLLAMIMTILYAFPMTMKRLKGRKFFMFFIVFTMYFSGGTIPIYLNAQRARKKPAIAIGSSFRMYFHSACRR